VMIEIITRGLDAQRPITEARLIRRGARTKRTGALARRGA
jgi:hypothetical protein